MYFASEYLRVITLRPHKVVDAQRPLPIIHLHNVILCPDKRCPNAPNSRIIRNALQTPNCARSRARLAFCARCLIRKQNRTESLTKTTQESPFITKFCLTTPCPDQSIARVKMSCRSQLGQIWLIQEHLVRMKHLGWVHLRIFMGQ